jgi:hypothetical protein
MGIAAWWINGYIIANYEVAQGVNLIYWPHGLRVVLTLLLERYAALGLVWGSVFVAQLTWPDDPVMQFGASMVSGSSAYVAQRSILRASKTTPSRLVGLTPANIVALGTQSALINAAGHTLLCIGSGTADPHADIFASMLAGDLLGALLFLYALKAILWILDRRSSK